MRIILILLIASWTQLASAKTIFEPGISFGMGSGEIEGVPDSSAEATVATFGFRYGITRRYIHVTGIVEGTFFKGEDTDAEFSGYGGLGIGYEWNIPLRTYLLLGAYDFDTDLMGTGVEVAYFFNQSFWIGARYVDFKSELSANNISAELKLSTISLIVSFPFEFNYPDHWFRKTDWE